jgi:hypothetical protein
LCKVSKLAKLSEKEALKKRIKVQQDFWSIVGSVEHINLPKLEDALRKEFKRKDARFIDAQIKLMQTEARIKMENRVKVWIKQPNTKTKIKELT